jgi:MFS family permease
LIVGLASVVFFGIAATVVWEQRATEPIIPGRIFRERQVPICVFGNFVGGMAFFGVIVYLPVFFQSVAGETATAAGLLLIPFALSTALSTAFVGNMVHRIGRAKAFLVAGMAAMTIGYALLSRVGADTSIWAVTSAAVVVGIGIGFVLQLMLFVVQRSVPSVDLGAATAVAMFARIFGSVTGVALLGNVFNRRLTDEIATRAPALASSKLKGDAGSIAALSAHVRSAVHIAYANALGTTFRVVVPVALAGLVATALLSERSVRERVATGPAVLSEPLAV